MIDFILYICILSIWNVILFYGKSYGISVLLFIIPLLILIYSVLKKNNKIKNKYGLLLMAPIILLSSTYFIFDSSVFKELNFIAITLLFILMYIFTIKPNYDLFHLIKEMFELLFEPLLLIGDYFELIVSSISKKFKIGNKSKRIFKSLLICTPIIIIVLVLLSSADMIFDKLFSNTFDKIFNIFDSDLIGKIILFIVIFFLIGVTLLYIVKKYPKKEEIKNQKEFIDKSTIKMLITVLNIIYLIFDFIQIKSLIFHYGLSNINYAEYARQGFFELMIVSLINISVLLFSKNNKYNKKEHKYINIMSIFMVIFTFIIIISSFLRMNLYEQAYGYTTLRLLVYISLITEIILLVPTILYIFKENFNVLKYYLIIILSVYTIINFINIDYIIARRNVNRYYDGKEFDISYLENYHTDNLKILNELYNDCDSETKISLNTYFNNLEDYNSNMKWQEFNISKYKNMKLIK